jgi:hypothetical protein
VEEEAFHLMAPRKQKEMLGTRYSLQGYTLLPPLRSHLLKFPETLKVAPPARDQAFNSEPVGDI